MKLKIGFISTVITSFISLSLISCSKSEDINLSSRASQIHTKRQGSTPTVTAGLSKSHLLKTDKLDSLTERLSEHQNELEEIPEFMEECAEFINESFNDIEQSKVLNRRGLAEKSRGEVAIASQLFWCASQFDPSFADAQYNFSAIMASLLESNFCDFEVMNDIKTHLSRALRLDSAYRSRLNADGQYDEIRDTLDIRPLTLNPTASDYDLLLNIQSWYGPQPGLLPTTKIDFYPDHRASIKYFQADKDSVSWSDAMEGTFSINNNQFNIIFDDPKRLPIHGTISIQKDKHLVKNIELNIKSLGIHRLSLEDCSS